MKKTLGMEHFVKQKYFEFAELSNSYFQKNSNHNFQHSFDSKNGFIVVLCETNGKPESRKVAKFTTEKIVEYFQLKFYKNPQAALKNALLYTNREVTIMLGRSQSMKGIGTNCSLILLRENRLYYAKVGQTNCFIVKNNEIKDIEKAVSFQQLTYIENEYVENVSEKALNNIGLDNSLNIFIAQHSITAENEAFVINSSSPLINSVDDSWAIAVLASSKPLLEKVKGILNKAVEKTNNDLNLQVIHFKNIPKKIAAADDSIFADAFQRLLRFMTSSRTLLILSLSILFLLLVHKITQNFFDIFQLSEKQNDQPVIEPNTIVYEEAEIPQDKTYRIVAFTKKNFNQYKPVRQEKQVKYQAVWGESFYVLAYRFNVSISRLKEINNQTDNFLMVNEELIIPLTAVHNVKAGDNLDSIAATYDVSKELIMRANKIRENATLTENTQLYIPLKTRY